MIRDRDAVYGSDFDRQLGLGIIAVRTPLKTSMANSIAGPIVRTSRTECLDHLVINERHPYVVGG